MKQTCIKIYLYIYTFLNTHNTIAPEWLSKTNLICREKQFFKLFNFNRYICDTFSKSNLPYLSYVGACKTCNHGRRYEKFSVSCN